MNDYFTADLHLHHQKVAAIRGFGTAEDHDRLILDGIRQLPADSRLFILGDLSKGNADLEELAVGRIWEAGRHLTGGMHLIHGNHDSSHPMRSRAHQSQLPAWFRSHASQGTVKIAGIRAVMCHHPYSGDHSGEDRHVQWRPRDLGAPIIHGHTHARNALSFSTEGSVQVCVSVDAWDFRPAPKESISGLIERNMNV